MDNITFEHMDCSCDDVPLLTYCKKCKNVYLVSSDGVRNEVDVTLKQLATFLKKADSVNGINE